MEKGKIKRIGGLIFRKTSSGLKLVGRKSYGGAKYLHSSYKKHKAGETERLRGQLEKERLKAMIRGYKSRNKKKTNYGKSIRELKSMFR